MAKQPYLFDEFFASGQQETVSPFITPNSKKWSKNLSLKISVLSALFLLFAYITFFLRPEISYLSLSFVYFFAGTPAIINAWEDIKHWEINIDILMTMAAFISLLLASPFEGALLLVLFSLSGSLEAMVSGKAKSALHSLHNLSPKQAFVLQESGETITKSIHDISPGEMILVRAGDTVPLDGIVMKGTSQINMAHLTGEAHPLVVKEGVEVVSGAINLDAGITVQVTKPSSESTLTKIIHLISKAQSAKAKVEKLLDRFGKKYSLTIMLLALFFALALPIIGLNFLGYEGSVYRALTFLIAASPCALIIATPTAYLSSISSCAKKGILLKGGELFDALSDCNHLSFDKTGTITKGVLTCHQFIPLGEKKTDLSLALSVAASLERDIVHPIATAILDYAKEKKAPFAPISDFAHFPGKGVSASYEGKKVLLGTDLFVLGKPFSSSFEDKMSSFLRIGDALFLFTFIDEVRKEAKEAIRSIQQMGLETIILSGDSEENVQRVAKEIGIDKTYGSLKPEEKLSLVESFASKGHAMVGDGINDAPSLARSTVGIAMGKAGSALAIESSDVVLLKEDLSLIPWLIKKSKKTKSIIRQNLTLSLSVIIFASSLALYGAIPLWLGVVLHEGGTLIVGLNSLRLLKK